MAATLSTIVTLWSVRSMIALETKYPLVFVLNTLTYIFSYPSSYVKTLGHHWSRGEKESLYSNPRIVRSNQPHLKEALKSFYFFQTFGVSCRYFRYVF